MLSLVVTVSSPLVPLGLNRDGTMQVPGDFQVAGWFTGGPQPGQLGPAVFHRLRDLRPGHQIRGVRADRVVSAVRVAAGRAEAGR